MLGTRGRGGRIRAPKRGLGRDDVDFDGIWKDLATAFQEINCKNASNLSFESLFRNAYKLVLKKRHDALYDRVVQFEQAWLQDQVRTQLQSVIAPSLLYGLEDQGSDIQTNERRVAGERFMVALKHAFQDHSLFAGLKSDVLMYLDRVIGQDGRRPLVYTMAMGLFRSEVLLAPLSEDSTLNILSLLEATVLDMIGMERKGELTDRPLIRACTSMLERLYVTYAEDEATKLYLTSFEPKFLETSKEFYHTEGQTLVANADASTFCSHARKRLREEEERCQQTISPITESKIKQVIDREFILAHIKDVVNMEGTGVRNMLDNDKFDDLRNMFELISRVDAKKVALKQAVQRRVRDLGTDINKAALEATQQQSKPAPKPLADKEKSPPERQLNTQTKAAIDWVEQILDLKSKYDLFLDRSFHKDKVMEKAMENSFQDFLNENDRSSEHLSLFLDEHLKRGTKGRTDGEIDTLLDKGILLLQYLSNTDTFETYYRKHLARRLLVKKETSRDMERQMLSKMKMKLGNNITQKLEGMIRDIELSEGLTTEYKKWLSERGAADPSRVDIDARILTTNQWPFDALFKGGDENQSRPSCKFPSSIERTQQLYQQFYLSRHTGRKLTWMPNLGDADLRAHFRQPDGKTKRYEVNISTYGMIILMLFNKVPDGQCLTLEEIEAETNIFGNDLLKNLSSLCNVPKWRLLRKEPSTKEIQAGDKFYFNSSFQSQYVRIKISGVVSSSSKVETPEERKETQQRIDTDRSVSVDAAIVRIMKQRKNLSHQNLMTEVLQQLAARFHPDVNMIKKRIEALIEREYLERGPDPAKPSYIYLA